MDAKRLAEINAARENIRKRVIEAHAPAALESLDSMLKQYTADSSSFSNLYNSRYFDEEGNYINQYRSDSSDWVSSVQKALAQNDAKASEIKSYLERYKSFLPEDYYSNVSDILATNSKALSDIYSSSREEHDFWSQFKNEGEYKTALAKLEEDEKKRTYDLEAGAAEIEALKAELAEAREEAKKYNNAIPSDEYLKHETTPEARERAIREYQARQNGIWDRAASALEKEIAKKVSYFEKAREVQTDWLNPDGETNAEKVARRKDIYESNIARIAEINKKISKAKSGHVTYETKEAIGELAKEKEKLEAENRQYERTQKTLDYYYNLQEKSDFDDISANRDYMNPTKEAMSLKDIALDSSQWYWNNGKLYDGLGNEINTSKTDSKGNIVHPLANTSEVTDKLGLYLNATEQDIKEALGVPVGQESTWDSMLKDGYDNSWTELKDEEISTYYYLLNTSGQEEAYKFLDLIKTELNRRSTNKMAEKIDDAGFLEKLALNAASVPANLLGGAAGLIEDAVYSLQGKDINPYSNAHSLSNFASATRGKIAADINNATGNATFLGVTLGDAYQSLMSGADSLVAGGVFGATGAGILLGTNAATSEAKRLYEEGASSGQVALGGILAGAVEMVFEKFSLDRLLDPNITSKTKLQLIKNALIQGGVEASEEAFTEIANKISDLVVRGSQADTIKLIDEYMAQGKSRGEATLLALKDSAVDVWKAAVGGFISGVPMGGVQQTANYAQYNSEATQEGQKIINDGVYDSLRQLANDVIKAKGVDSGLVEKFAKAADKNQSAKNVGKLSDAIETARIKQNKVDVVSELRKNGLSSKEANRIAQYMNDTIDGVELSEADQKNFKDILSNNKGALDVWKSLVGQYDVRSGEVIIDPKNHSVNKRNVQHLLGRIGEAETNVPEANQKGATNGPSETKIADATDKVSVSGKTHLISTGEEVSIKKIVSIDTQNKTMKLELADGKIVDSKDVVYGNNEQAALYETTLQMGYDAHTANLMVHGYTANSPTSVENYLAGTKKAFDYGWRHASEAARVDEHYKALTPAEREYAYKLGEDARAADDKAREAKAKQNQPQAAKKKSKGKYEVRLAVDEKSLTDRAKESVKALNEVAKALKVNIVVDNLNGNAYGYYNPSTNEIIIDANAGGKGKSTLLFTASHELVHYIRNWSPGKFTVLADFLMEQYAAKGEDIDALIKAEIDKAYKATRGKVEMTYDEAYEEVVAQAMQGFLTDSNFIERLAALQKKDASLAKRLISKLKEILNNIRAAYQGINPDSRASEAVKEMGEAVDELYAKMKEALIAASEASQTIGSRNLEEFSEAKNTEGKELFQYKAMEADEEAYRQMLKKHGIMSEADINRLFSTIDKALVIIKNNLEVLDYAWEVDIDDRAYSPVKSNSDNLYKVSLDFSTLCRKRILQQVIQTQLQDALNKPLSREESIAIRDELMKIQEEGRQIEIACALCYVESARMKSPAQIKKFLKNRDAVIKEFLASKSGGEIKQKIAKAEADVREKLGVGKATLKSLPEKIAEQIREAKRESKKAYTPTPEEQKLIDAAKSMTVTDFTSPEGLAKLAKNYPVLFDAYTSYVRNATKSKGIEKDVWWRAGDSKSIGDTLIANMNRENGLRSQSWSDFQVIHMLDYIAATIELSTRNAKEQAYSKVPDYIELMGNTGVMLNMSLIPMAKFNGKLEYDSVEGMAYKKALELREKYHATAGTICIGISDEQIKMLLDDSSIDYVIPYHKSGMAAHIRKLMHIPTWSEYEKYQNETNLSRSEAEKQAKKYGVKLLSESDENYQKHTSFSEWFDLEEARQIAKQENAFPTDAKLQKKLGVMYGGYMAMQNAANNYLKLCAERGIAPKFSHENANFSEEANYWKLIIDRKMVDNVTGEIIEQQAIKPIFDEAEVFRILNDELERYPNVKADQDYAVRTVVEKFLSGKMNDRLDADTIAAIVQKPVDNITTTNIIASEDGVKAQYADENKKIDQNMTDSVIDLSWDNELAKIIEGETKTQKYKLLQKYIFDVLGGQELVLSDGRKAIVDKRDSQHLVQKAGSKKVAYLSKVKELIKTAKLFAYELDANHNKFNEFYYYKVAVKLEEDVFPIYVNVGKAKNDNTYHVYDITKKLRDSANLIGLEHPKPNEGYALKNAISNNNIPHTDEIVKGQSTTTDLKAQYADTDYAPTFYSQMGKVVEGVKQEKLAANSVVNMLRGKGVKAEEIRWSGIVQFLEGKKSVTKQELLDFINNSMLQVGEQSSSNDIDLRYDSSNHAYIHYDSDGNVVDTYTYNEFIGGYVSEASEEIYSNPYELQDALREEYGNMTSPRWSEYKLEGGSNYREIVFTMPNSSYSNQMMRTHWGDDAEGVLAHARIQDFDVNGKRMLFVEEIQSDYHNEGHQSGYTNSETDAKINELKSIAEEKFFAVEDYSTEMTGNAGEWEAIAKTDKGAKLLSEYREAKANYDNAMDEEVKKIPDAPFKDTYHEFVMKRLLRMAAEEGYDSIGWTTADTQDKRWDDRQYHEEGKGKSGNLVGYTIEYDQGIPKFLRKYGRQWDARVGKTTLGNSTEVWSMDITDSMKNSVLYEGQAMFQYKDLDAIDNRTLLAKSLEGAAKNDVEKTKLKEYQKKIELINAEEKKLRELRGQIKEISFSKGARDTEKLKKLQFEANQAANRINVYDKQLLRLEATKPLMDVLQREKDLVRKKMDQERKEAVRKAKEKDMATIREIMDRNTESRKKAKERRDMAEIRNKIKSFKAKLESNLLTPTDRGYVPFGLAQAIIDVCSLIDTDTELYKSDGNINKSQVQRNLTKEKLQALKDEYEKLKDYDDPIYSGEFDEAIYYMLKDLKDNFEGRNLKELNLDELRDMYDILRSIGDTLADARNLIGKGEAYDVYDAGYAIIEEQRGVAQKRKKDKRSGAQKAKDSVINLSLAPVRNVERISGYKEDSVLVDLFNDFEIGVRQKNLFEMESKKGFEAVTTGKNAKAYESAVYDAFGNKEYMDDRGKKFSISKMQMMQAILSQDRERANGMNHIKGGGLAFADLNLLRKGNLKEAISTENTHLVSNADGVVEQFRQELADDKWAQDYMAAARAFFDGKAKDAINNTMLTLKHRIVAKDKNYIPFEVDKSFVVREISAANDIQQTINSYGMLQETKDKAPQPLIMTGLNNIVDRHIDQVSAVVGLAIPVRNFNKVWNVHSVDGVNTTVNGIVETNWGAEGRKFIEQVVQDIQGPRHNTQSELYKKVKSGYIGATFLFNGSVVTKQIGSLFSATSMLKWRNPASMIGNLLYTMANYKKIAAEVDKYTASAWMRRQGMSDAEVYTLLTEGKKHPITKALNKLPAPLNPAKWITAMDSAVALSLWKYAKQDVQKAHPELSGEELNKAAASFYDSVIENTQSMTDVLHRPEIQKRSDILSEAFGMFKTDAYQMAGQLQNAMGRFSENKSKENAKYLGKTVGSIALSAMWGSLMTTVFALLRYKVKPYRDDEDDELTVESWLKRQGFAFGGDIMGYILPLFGSEIVGTIENIVYGESEDIADSLALTAINDLYSTMVNIASTLKEGEAPSIDDYKKLLTKSLQVFGIPANNLLRTIDAIRLHAKDIANGEFFSFEAGREKSNGQSLYEAILRGNEEQIEEFKLKFDDEDAIDNALVKAIRENNVDVVEAASKFINGNLSAYESMVASLVRQGFDEDVAVRAIRSVITMVNSAAQLKADGNTKKYDKAVDNLEDLGYDIEQLEKDIVVIGKTPSEPTDGSDEAESIYKAADINAFLEKGDTTTALKVIDDIVQVKTENYISDGYKKSEAKKKAEASVKSSVSSYWKPLYLEAKANKNLAEVTRIKNILKATKLYDNVTKTTDDWWVEYKKTKK